MTSEEDLNKVKLIIFDDFEKAWNPQTKSFGSLAATARTTKNFSRIENLIEEYLNENPYSHNLILDVGCGAGKSTAKLKEMFPAAKVYGVDMIRHALVEAKKNSNANFICASMEHLPFKDKVKFDTIVAGESIDLFPDRVYLKDIVGEITKYSADKARFYMAFYGSDIQNLELELCTPIGLTLDDFGWKNVHGRSYNLTTKDSYYPRGVFWVAEKINS